MHLLSTWHVKCQVFIKLEEEIEQYVEIDE